MVVINPNEESTNKIKGEIAYILNHDHLKRLKKDGLIPELFIDEKTKETSKTFDFPDSSDDDLPRNPNYSTDSDEESDSDSE